MTKKDYYETLGVQQDVDEQTLKKAYRRLAMRFHPDRNPDDAAAEAKFKEATEAYQVLSDADKRRAYDRYGHASVDGNAGAGAGFHGGFGDIFSDVFGDIFGSGGSSRTSAQRGSDLRYRIELNLEQAIKGTKIEIQVPTLVQCKPCQGSGAKPGTSPVQCSTCRGAGQIHIQQGVFSLQQTCSSCGGQGTVIKHKCPTCRGRTVCEERKTLSVKIPAGIDQGDQIRLLNEGEAGVQGGQSGDLYVEVQLRKHPIFERDGHHLKCEVPVTFFEAILGGELEIPTLDGRVRLSIPEGTQTGRQFRLREKGVKTRRGTGDLICRVLVETPTALTKQQKDILRDCQRTLGDLRHSPQKTSWINRVSQFFKES